MPTGVYGSADLSRNSAVVDVAVSQSPNGQTTAKAAVVSALSAQDSNGDAFNPDSLPQVLVYDGSNNLSTITVTDGTSTWVQTFTYTAGDLTGVSAWVKQ